MFSFFTCDEEKKSKTDALKRWGVFLGIAIFALFLYVLPFMIRGNYLAWGGTGAYSDGIAQHATFLEYMFKHGLFSGLGEYDYNIGLGADYAVAFAYYTMFDPVNFLLYILPRSNFLLSYSVLACIRFLICAICMYVYLRSHKVRQTLSVVFSVAYMLSGYIMFTFTRHPCLTAGAMYLPLITLGLEKAIDKNNPFILIAFTFLTTISSFYMAYMVTIYAVLYAVLYYVNKVHAQGEKIKARKFAAVFFRTAGYYLIGLLIASFMLFPVAYGYITGARGDSKGLAIFSPFDLLSIFVSFFAPYAGKCYTAVMLNIVAVLLGFAAFAACPRAVMSKMTVILTVCLFIPVAGYVMNIFNYANNRYTYMFSFCAYALIAQFLNGLNSGEIKKKERSIIIKGAVTVCVIAVNLVVWWLIYSIVVKAHAVFGALIATAAVAVTASSAFALYGFYKTDISGDVIFKKIGYGALIWAFVGFVLVQAVIFGAVYSSQFNDNGKRYSAYVSAPETYAATTKTDDFVRLDTYADACNRPLNNGYKGTVIYNSMYGESVSEFLSANMLYTFSPTLGMSGLNGRTALQALLCTKYYYATKTVVTPTGFNESEDISGLYIADDYVRFGTVFENTVSEEFLYSIPEIERQYLMLSGVVIENGKITEYTPLVAKKESTEKAFTLYPENTKNINIDGALGADIYLKIRLAELPTKKTVVTVSCGEESFEIEVAPKGHQMYTGQTEWLMKLDGRSDNVSISIKNGMELKFEETEFYEVSEAAIMQLIRAASARAHLTDTEFNSRGFVGKINSSGGTMLIQLPYSKGWKAEVDGERAEVKKADCGLMAIEVSGGEHDVKFTYRTPWLNAGIAVTAVAAAVCAGLIVATTVIKLRRRERKNG